MQKRNFLDLESLKGILKEDDYKLMLDHSSDGKVAFFSLPDNTFVVPSFDPPSYDCPTKFTHIRKGFNKKQRLVEM